MQYAPAAALGYAVIVGVAMLITDPPRDGEDMVRDKQPRPQEPDAAIEFRNLQLRDENGVIAPDGLVRARRQMAAMRLAAIDAAAPGAGGISPRSWTSLGPGNIGGRVRSILVHPRTPSTMFLGAVAGGIWKTTNAGATWTAVDDFMANLAVSTMVFDPRDADTMYAGTGEGFFNADGIRGAGIFKSTDGGANWRQLPATDNPDFHYVNRLAMAPNGTTLLAATRRGLYRSTDGGNRFRLVLSPDPDYFGGFVDVKFSPADNSRAVAATFYGAALYSTTSGASWTGSTGLPGKALFTRVEVAYAASNPDVAYASVDLDGGSIYRSDDGGRSYSLRCCIGGQPDYLGGQGWYDNVIWVDPTDPNFVVVGGIDLWKSANAGASLEQISTWWAAPRSAHADHHVIVAHPGYDGAANRTVYFGNDGGIYRTDDVRTVGGGPPQRATGWVELNNTLGITQYYGAAGHPATGTIVGGTQDNGTLQWTRAGGSENVHTTFGGDGGFTVSDPSDPDYFYGEIQWLGVHRSADGGRTASFITDGLDDSGNTGDESCTNFIAPLTLDPNAPGTLYAGGCSLWRTTDAKAARPIWTVHKPRLPGEFPSPISAIAVAPGDSDVIYVGHNNGDVYRTVNGTADAPTWNRTDAASLPNRMVLRLTASPHDPREVFATFGGFQPDNIWRSTDGGASWTDVTGSGNTGLPDVPVRDIDVHPAAETTWYAATEVGIFASDDAGSTWSLPHDGPANVSVDELFFMGRTLVAATHGRGLFAADVDLRCRIEDLGALTGRVTRTGRLGRDCVSPNRTGALARYYSFTLRQPANVDIRMTSPEVDSWLALRQGANVEGAYLGHDDGGGAGLDARLVAGVNAGTYTIEATTAEPGVAATGSFTLTVDHDGPIGGGFTDDPILVGRTVVRTVHFTELRTRIDALRRRFGARSFPWTDPVLGPGGTPVRAVHVTELRTALADAYEAAGVAVGFDTAAVQAGSPIGASHVNDLRGAVRLLEQ